MVRAGTKTRIKSMTVLILRVILIEQRKNHGRIVKALLSPLGGGYLILERQGYMRELFRSFSSHFAHSICNSMSQIRKFDTFSIPNSIKTSMQCCLTKHMENRWLFLELDINGVQSLTEMGLFKISAQMRGAGMGISEMNFRI